MYQMIFILWKSITKAVSISCVSNWLSYLARYYHDTTLDQGNLAHTPQSPLMPYPTNDTCGKNHINHPIHNTLPESDTHADASVSDNTTIQYILASQGRITCNTIHSLTSFASRILPHSLATLAHVALAPWVTYNNIHTYHYLIIIQSIHYLLIHLILISYYYYTIWSIYYINNNNTSIHLSNLYSIALDTTTYDL